MMQNRPLEELLHHMKSLARRMENDWEANFARSMLRNGKRPGWTPTIKQKQIMQRLVSEMFARGGALEDDDLELIDRGDRIYAA
jgi:hypothetical protein